MAEVLYSMTTGWVKISILMLYRRIFPSKSFHIIVWANVAVICAYLTASILLSILQCIPIASGWDPTISGICLNYYAVVVVVGVINIVTGFIILAS